MIGFRNFHQLRVNEKLSYPQHVMFIDTETTTIKDDEDEHEPKLILGVVEDVSLTPDLAVDNYERMTFRDLDSFYEFVDTRVSHSKKVYLFAHNWSFDLPVLDMFNRLPLLGYTMKSIVDASPPIIIRYSRPGSQIFIVDSLNFFQQSLESMSKIAGVEKIKIDLETCEEEELETYCQGDVEILRKSIISLLRFLKDNNLSRFTHTVSSLALSSFVRRFNKHKVLIDANKERCEMGRKSYFGGRTEAFYIGRREGKFYLIDVNSQYPSVMKDNYFPVKASHLYKRFTLKDLEICLKKYCLTAKCLIDTTESYLPLKVNKRTCFPVGRFTSYLSTPELEIALEKDDIVKIEKVVLYQREKIFTDYVKYFYDKRVVYRKEGNEAYAEFCKKMLNTLYGKFGQQLHEWVKTEEDRKPGCWKWFDFDLDENRRDYYMYLDGQVFKSVRQTESRDSFPAIAAHVTAYGRLLLYKMIDMVGEGNALYCDTDSLLLTERGYSLASSHIDDTELGAWSLDDSYTVVEIRGAKDYKFDSKEKIKGVRKQKVKSRFTNTVEGETGGDEPKYCYVRTPSGGYKQLQFTNLKGTIRSGKHHTPVIRNVVKNLSRLYQKAGILSNSYTHPFWL